LRFVVDRSYHLLDGVGLGPPCIPASRRAAGDPQPRGAPLGNCRPELPLGAAVATEVLALLAETRPWERAARLGERLVAQLRAAALPCVREVRGRGLLVGIVLDPARADAAELAERLLDRGIATRDTTGNVIRLAPPLIIDEATLDAGAATVIDTLAGCGR